MARKARRRKKTPIGCLVWFVLMLVVAVVFLATRSSIARAVESSGLAQLLGMGRASGEPTGASDAASESPEPMQRPGGEPAESDTPAAAARPGAGAPPPAASRGGSEQNVAPGSTSPATRPEATPEGRETRSQEQAAPTKHRNTLYFVTIDDGGAVSLAGVDRQIASTDAPLTRALEALVEGPLPAEQDRGYRSLIPSDTRIESVSVRDKTAFLSFNEPFRFNQYGRDGLVGQLKQVVYTATEFPSIERVQLLIGGRVTDYLGPEGIRIREPLSRGSFDDEGP